MTRLKNDVGSLTSLEYQKPTRYHADVVIKGRKVTKHYSTHSFIEARSYFGGIGEVIKFWRD
ncbi:MAG: hypothetical protein PHS93_09495 [Candidatus Omnitrophica bacterium]|jgi:hypothetical protein|nr:hypothetical protein [Candidatus Omnitrophota bacterium]MDD5353381.1 hypothetical protein [Candidatus Omnitrophota bacterium]MDD5551435.1 hypothetical protein [Candidatus Omnitrophota bacterium]